jgi:hypothetical protein
VSCSWWLLLALCFSGEETMKTSESQKELVAALLAAQQAFPVIDKSKDGQAGNRKFKYAPLEAIKALCDPVLWANGLIVTQGAEGHFVVTRLDHSSGEWRETRMPMNEVHSSDQAYGIEFMYKRRYSYQSIIGIVTEEDVDGNSRKRGEKPAEPGVQGSVKHAVRDGIGDDLPEDWKIYLRDLADDCTALVKQGKVGAAVERIREAALEADQETYMTNQMDAPIRGAIKKASQSTKEAATA